jgi:hypothetical protein
LPRSGGHPATGSQNGRRSWGTSHSGCDRPRCHDPRGRGRDPRHLGGHAFRRRERRGRGAREHKTMVAQHGKAAAFQEKSVGHQDACATVGVLMIQTMRDFAAARSSAGLQAGDETAPAPQRLDHFTFRVDRPFGSRRAACFAPGFRNFVWGVTCGRPLSFCGAHFASPWQTWTQVPSSSGAP